MVHVRELLLRVGDMVVMLKMKWGGLRRVGVRARGRRIRGRRRWRIRGGWKWRRRVEIVRALGARVCGFEEFVHIKGCRVV